MATAFVYVLYVMNYSRSLIYLGAVVCQRKCQRDEVKLLHTLMRILGQWTAVIVEAPVSDTQKRKKQWGDGGGTAQSV